MRTFGLLTGLGIGIVTVLASAPTTGLWSENANATAAEIDLCVEYDGCLSFPSAAGAGEWIGYVACGSREPRLQFNDFLGVQSPGAMVNGRHVL